jgi:hypothetical protein
VLLETATTISALSHIEIPNSETGERHVNLRWKKLDDCLTYHIIASRCEELGVDILDWMSSPKRTYKLIDDKMRECIEILKWRGGTWDLQRRLYRIHTRNYFTAREIRLLKRL